MLRICTCLTFCTVNQISVMIMNEPSVMRVSPLAFAAFSAASALTLSARRPATVVSMSFVSCPSAAESQIAIQGVMVQAAGCS